MEGPTGDTKEERGMGRREGKKGKVPFLHQCWALLLDSGSRFMKAIMSSAAEECLRKFIKSDGDACRGCLHLNVANRYTAVDIRWSCLSHILFYLPF